MAFKIQDLMIDVLPGNVRWAGTCIEATFMQSECADPSCAQCVPHSCDMLSKEKPQPQPPEPGPQEAVPNGLLELRRQLRQTLSGEL